MSPWPERKITGSATRAPPVRRAAAGPTSAPCARPAPRSRAAARLPARPGTRRRWRMRAFRPWVARKTSASALHPVVDQVHPFQGGRARRHRGFLLVQRRGWLKARAASGPRRPQAAVVGLHHRAADRQSHAHAVGLGGIKGAESASMPRPPGPGRCRRHPRAGSAGPGRVARPPRREAARHASTALRSRLMSTCSTAASAPGRPHRQRRPARVELGVDAPPRCRSRAKPARPRGSGCLQLAQRLVLRRARVRKPRMRCTMRPASAACSQPAQRVQHAWVASPGPFQRAQHAGVVAGDRGSAGLSWKERRGHLAAWSAAGLRGQRLAAPALALLAALRAVTSTSPSSRCCGPGRRPAAPRARSRQRPAVGAASALRSLRAAAAAVLRRWRCMPSSTPSGGHQGIGGRRPSSCSGGSPTRSQKGAVDVHDAAFEVARAQAHAERVLDRLPPGAASVRQRSSADSTSCRRRQERGGAAAQRQEERHHQRHRRATRARAPRAW